MFTLIGTATVINLTGLFSPRVASPALSTLHESRSWESCPGHLSRYLDVGWFPVEGERGPWPVLEELYWPCANVSLAGGRSSLECLKESYRKRPGQTISSDPLLSPRELCGVGSRDFLGGNFRFWILLYFPVYSRQPPLLNLLHCSPEHRESCASLPE